MIQDCQSEITRPLLLLLLFLVVLFLHLPLDRGGFLPDATCEKSAKSALLRHLDSARRWALFVIVSRPVQNPPSSDWIIVPFCLVEAEHCCRLLLNAVEFCPRNIVALRTGHRIIRVPRLRGPAECLEGSLSPCRHLIPVDFPPFRKLSGLPIRHWPHSKQAYWT